VRAHPEAEVHPFWSINSANGLFHDTLQLLNGGTLHPGDYRFV